MSEHDEIVALLNELLEISAREQEVVKRIAALAQSSPAAADEMPSRDRLVTNLARRILAAAQHGHR